MLGDHWPLILLVLLVALVIFGPKRLPELGQSLGRALNEFRHASQSTIGDPPIAAPPAGPQEAPSSPPPAPPAVGAAPGPTDRAS